MVMSDMLKKLTAKQKQFKALQPFPPELSQNLDEWFKVELTYSSNAIEGNTLTRLETAEIIEKGITAVISGKSLRDQLEAVNHAKALDYIKNLAKDIKSHQFITEDHIKAVHKIILTGIDDGWAGKYRLTDVFIRGSDTEFPSPHAVPYAMKEFIQWLNGQQIAHPVRVAADTHFKFVSIHPFIDGNGRTARLLMNLVLIMHGYPMAVIRNENRTEYLATFDKARNEMNMQPFYDIVENAVESSLDVYIKAGKGEDQVLAPLSQSSNKDIEADKDGKLLKIGELAKETGETLHTIRHWVEKGLLEISEFTDSGYQLFDRSMIDRISRIRRLQKEERLSIEEIRKRLSGN